MAKADYYLIHQNVDHSYKVTKLDQDFEPLTSYQVAVMRNTKIGCNCPAYRGECRHLAMVRLFKAAGEPPNVMINQKTGTFEPSPFSMEQ